MPIPGSSTLLRRSAAEALANGAPASAAAMLTRALEEPAAADERPSLRLDLGRALARNGDLDRASAALQRALEEVDDPVARAGIALELGRALRLAQRPVEAITVLDQAVNDLPTGHHDEEISLEGEIAFASHMGPVTDWIDRFAAVAERADGPSLPDRMVRSFYSYVAATTGTATAEEVGRLARSAVTPADDDDPPAHAPGGGRRPGDERCPGRGAQAARPCHRDDPTDGRRDSVRIRLDDS